MISACIVSVRGGTSVSGLRAASNALYVEQSCYVAPCRLLVSSASKAGWKHAQVVRELYFLIQTPLIS
jgi:hypothetical protein